MKKGLIALILLMLVATTACEQIANFGSTNAPRRRGRGRSSMFFPKDYFNMQFDGDRAISRMYTVYMNTIEEPSIYCNKLQDQETYRLIWSGPQRAPISIRAHRKGSEYQLIMKELIGHSATERGDSKVTKKQLEPAQWDGLIEQLQKAEFWQLSTSERRDGKDPIRWIFEGVTEQNYHTVERWSVDAEKMQPVCVYLAKLSGVEFSPEMIANPTSKPEERVVARTDVKDIKSDVKSVKNTKETKEAKVIKPTEMLGIKF